MNCVKCNEVLKEGAKFCVKCGEKVILKKRCQWCNTVIGQADIFCAECGKPITISSGIASPKVFKSFMQTRLTKAQSAKLSEEEKKIIQKLKKHPDFILYDNERNFIFLQRDNWSYIEVISPSTVASPVTRYTIPIEFNQLGLWQKRFLFYTNEDAFIVWDEYIFLSVYNGLICWSAANIRSIKAIKCLPGGKVDENIGDIPEVELLPSGGLKVSFYHNKAVEYQIKQGVLIRCNEVK